MKRLLMSIALTVLLCSNSFAYSIMFDGSGESDYKAIDNLELGSYSSYDSRIDALSGESGIADIFTYQTGIPGSFTESFTLQIVRGVRSSFPSQSYNYDNLFVDIVLSGFYNSDSNIVFNTGSAIMYKESDDLSIPTNFAKYDAADDSIASLVLQYALPTDLDGSLLGANGLSMTINAAFEFLSINGDYWGEYEVNTLFPNGWLLALTQNTISQEGIWAFDAQGNPVSPLASNDIVIAWSQTGGEARFMTPEPSSVLLLGLGMLGIVGFGRKRFGQK